MRRARGFTLMETLAAVLLVAIVLPVAMQGISQATQLGEVARRRAEAATLAHSVLCELQVTKAWQSGALAGDFGADHPDYRWFADVTAWDSGTMSQLQVAVVWTRGGREQSVVLTTLVSAEATE